MTEEDKTTLSAAQVEAVLLTLEGWSRSEAVLARTFVFPNFSERCEYLEQERAQHAPAGENLTDIASRTDLQERGVAYLLGADNSISPLLSRLRGAQQLVVRPRHACAAPCSHLLARF
jgi:hypothetical protein